MAKGEVQWDNLEPTPEITDSTEFAALKPTYETGTRRLKGVLASVVKSWILGFSEIVQIGTNTSDISQNASDIDALEDIIDPIDRTLSLTSGRITIQEKASTLGTDIGWYTVAESTAVSYEVIDSDLSFVFRGSARVGRLKAHIGFCADTSIDNPSCELLSIENSVGVPLGSIRLAYSNVINAGIKVQLYMDPNSGKLLSGIRNLAAVASGSSAGLSLVTPYLDNTPTLPDGITSATYLNARYVYPVESTISATGSFDVGVDDHIIKINTASADVTVTLSDGAKEGQKEKLFCSGANLAYLRGSGSLTGGRKSGIWDGGSSTGVPISDGKIIELEWSEDNNIWLVSDAVTADYQDVEQRIIQSSNGDMEIICSLSGVSSASASNIFGSSSGTTYTYTAINSFSVPFTSAPDYLTGVLVSAISARLGVSAAAGYNVILYTSLTGQTANATVYFVGKW